MSRRPIPRLALVYRRAYVLLIGTQPLMGVLAVLAAVALDKRLADPEGFLGPSWLRLPMLLFGAFLLDMLPRAVALSDAAPRRNGRSSSASAWRDALDPRADHPGGDGRWSASTSSTSATGT